MRLNFDAKDNQIQELQAQFNSSNNSQNQVIQQFKNQLDNFKNENDDEKKTKFKTSKLK